MIVVVEQLAQMREQVARWKRDGLRVGFVATMGNLHEGHYSLVQLARGPCDRVVASAFVNPIQFGPNEDYARYPRTPEADAAGLDGAGCDLLWLPSVGTMYPYGIDAAVRVRVPGITDVLDGAHRPGHFDGVATVVARLLNQVQPDIAVFGRKDYQQLAVIRYLVRDLAFPVELLAGDTKREADGLAMSSRNQYLSAAERARGPEIHATLQAMRAETLAGTAHAIVENQARERLAAAGFEVDYAVIRRPDLTEPPDGTSPQGTPQSLVALIAARLGRTRLIDNLEFAYGR